MPTSNKHRYSPLLTSKDQRPCRKNKCNGVMVTVLVQYFDHGPIHEEKECTFCDKVFRDPEHRKKISMHLENIAKQKHNKKRSNKPRQKPNQFSNKPKYQKKRKVGPTKGYYGQTEAPAN